MVRVLTLICVEPGPMGSKASPSTTHSHTVPLTKPQTCHTFELFFIDHYNIFIDHYNYLTAGISATSPLVGCPYELEICSDGMPIMHLNSTLPNVKFQKLARPAVGLAAYPQQSAHHT